MKRTALVLGVLLGLLSGAPAQAHEEEGVASTPPSGSTIDLPISQVTIDFGEDIADVELALLDPDEEIVAGTSTELLSLTTARIDFAELEREGTYTVRYLASLVDDGHTLAGAVRFTYGSAGGSSNTGAILLFVLGAVVVLSVGAYFSWRRYRVLSEVDEDLADVGV